MCRRRDGVLLGADQEIVGLAILAAHQAMENPALTVEIFADGRND